MIYTDKTHLVGDTLNELHAFCVKIGLKRCWFEGLKKGHPHYDLINRRKLPLFCFVRQKTFLDIAIENGAIVTDRKTVWSKSVNSLINKTQLNLYESTHSNLF